ncbi:aspartic proteinase precursor [Cymbomonas tetramitiformis]|uniref:Aspartic proteinase n=1 Tax=Cymbomonas tetramitiformis TaxID=36881 RepID=A0AAE0GD31_9CHLO|nr:aspartic proteinase precursor [Cymbomonas tetramitiformis]
MRRSICATQVLPMMLGSVLQRQAHFTYRQRKRASMCKRHITTAQDVDRTRHVINFGKGDSRKLTLAKIEKEYYTACKGDSLHDLARTFGIQVEELYSANETQLKRDLVDTAKTPIPAGMRLIVPTAQAVHKPGKVPSPWLHANTDSTSKRDSRTASQAKPSSSAPSPVLPVTSPQTPSVAASHQAELDSLRSVATAPSSTPSAPVAEIPSMQTASPLQATLHTAPYCVPGSFTLPQSKDGAPMELQLNVLKKLHESPGGVGKQIRKDMLLAVQAPWCRFCTEMHPEYCSLSRQLQSDPTIIVAQMRGDVDRAFVAELGVRTFPTILAFPRSGGQPFIYGSEIQSGFNPMAPVRDFEEVDKLHVAQPIVGTIAPAKLPVGSTLRSGHTIELGMGAMLTAIFLWKMYHDSRQTDAGPSTRTEQLLLNIESEIRACASLTWSMVFTWFRLRLVMLLTFIAKLLRRNQ